MRESLFNILAHSHELPQSRTRVLDLFAGTGALGLEALSRGADFVLFMETGVEGRALIRQNIQALELTGVARVFRRDATRPGNAGTIAPFGLILCDPPYRKDAGTTALAAARAGNWMLPDALCVLEEAADQDIVLPDGFALLDRRTIGESQILFLRSEPILPEHRQ